MIQEKDFVIFGIPGETWIKLKCGHMLVLKTHHYGRRRAIRKTYDCKECDQQ